jgi:hypothetical protein
MAKRDFLQVMKEAISAIAPGLNNVGAEIGAELSRLGKQGALEMAQALFNGAAFTPYGPGQYTPTPQVGKDHGQEVKTEPQQEREHGGRE